MISSSVFDRFQIVSDGLDPSKKLFKPSLGSRSSVWSEPFLVCLLSLAGRSTLKKSLDVSKRLLFHNHRGRCAPGNAHSFRNSFIESGGFLLLCGSAFVLTCNGNCVTLHTHRCLPLINYVQSIHCAVGGLQSSSGQRWRINKAEEAPDCSFGATAK